MEGLLAIRGMSREAITAYLDMAESMIEVNERAIKKVPTLRGKTVINLFFEDSTRTRTSFEIAGKRLSADVINFSAKSSSVSKGEGLIDTVRNISAMQPDCIVIRHPSSGALDLVRPFTDAALVNAGDGWHEHPTQALLDCLTLRRAGKHFDGLRVVIAGDILHSRVARSNLAALTALGSTATVTGPRTLIPNDIETLGARYQPDFDLALRGADVILMLRIQNERLTATSFPNVREYADRYGLTAQRLRLAHPEAVVMHPGPMNRGVEISDDVADGARSVILDQVANGVAVRMAVIYHLISQRERRLSAGRNPEEG